MVLLVTESQEIAENNINNVLRRKTKNYSTTHTDGKTPSQLENKQYKFNLYV